ncbi:chemotaxis protein CheX [Natronincola peptidivorans]|uniref:Chemotaxis protein CheX n=1 Tax=Natronincola peptidivorans TaxID=426128 RepID=A0A1I0DCD4_9FIRM|nr:chemotaxis protein CheX [Natronincola peptidivorans]SET29975.1 chemotaxis protein CheX [Natronincola peptidivorans]
MKAEYINPFYKATKDVFQLMLDIDTQKGNIRMVEDMVNGKDANVALGVTGDLNGTIVFSFPKDMTLQMIKIMSGMEIDKIDSFASSALGEVANIIGGNALTALTESNYVCDLAPPQIFVGGCKSFSMANEKGLLLSLATPIGEFDINIMLKEK